MTTVYLIRHGQVDGNGGAHPVYSGQTDVPLNQQGRQQAEKLVPFFDAIALDAIYCSALQRTSQTAQPVADRKHLPIQKVSAFSEIDYGKWEGLTLDQLEKDWTELWQARLRDTWKTRSPGGESYADVWARLHPAWEQLLSRHQGQTIALFSHKGPLRLLLAALLGAPPQDSRRIDLENTGISLVELEDDNTLVRYVNRTAHLL